MYQVEQRSDATVLHVRDDVDMASRKAFETVLEAALASDPSRLIVSFEDCTYCDSTGLGILVGAQKRIGSRLTVVAPESGVCRRLLTVSGISKFIRCTPTLDAAFLDEAV